MAGHRACGQNFGITGFSEYSRILLSRCLGWLKKLGCWQLGGETWACRDVEVLHKPEPFSYFHQPPSPCLLLSLCSTNTFCYQGAQFSLGSVPHWDSYNYHVYGSTFVFSDEKESKKSHWKLKSYLYKAEFYFLDLGDLTQGKMTQG